MKRLIALILVILMSLSFLAATKPSEVYDEAQMQMVEGNYTKAAELFDSISSYEDSSKMSMYSKALAFGEAGQYDDAISALTFLGDFKDSSYLVSYYTICKFAYGSGTWSYPYPLNMIEAAKEFDAISVFRDSKKRAEECRGKAYDIASVYYQEEKFETAQLIFEELEGYKDSVSQVEKCKTAILNRDYEAALALKDAGKYSEAIAAFRKLDGYKDSAAQITLCETAIKDGDYEAALALKDAGKYSEAIISFQKMNGYKDSATQITACQEAIKEEQYQQAVALNKAGKYEEAYAAFSGLTGYKDVDSIIKTDKNIAAAAARAAYLAQFAVGKTVTFGNYEQDNNTANGKEEIEWVVLAREDNKALLISKYALDCQAYHTSYTDITWEECTLRTWLNGTFLNAAFSSEEQKQILTTTVTADKNPNYNTNPGNNTSDKIFLLSITEAKRYFSSDSARQCKPTAYAKEHECYVNSNNGNCWWCLRSPGIYQSIAAFVNHDGSVYTVGDDVGDSFSAIRPALWINLDL